MLRLKLNHVSKRGHWCLWIMRAETQPWLAWWALPWLSTIIMIQIRARSSLGVVIRNRCPWSFWIALLVFRTRWRTLEMPPCDTRVLRYLPVRQPTTRQLNNEFKNYTWVIGWQDCHFVLKLQCMHSDSTHLNIFNANVTHCRLEWLEKSAILMNELLGQERNGHGL